MLGRHALGVRRVVLGDPSLWIVVSLASALAGVSIMLTRHVPLPPDAVEYAAATKSLLSGRGLSINFVEFHPGLLPRIRHPLELHGILSPILCAPLFALFGPEATLVRIPSVLSFAGLVVVTFMLARHLFGNRAGLIAAFGMLLRTDIILDALFGGDDVGWAFLSTLSVFFFLRALDSGHRREMYAAGWLAALATLQKYTGVVLPIIFCVVLLFRRSSVRFRLASIAAVAAPVALAASAYAWKNYAIHGHFFFRFTALDWLAREDNSAYFAYHDPTPRLGAVWEHMGASRVFELVLVQLRALRNTVLENKVTAIGGLLSLVWAMRTRLAFGLLSLLYTAALTVIVCVAYHVEGRYLFALIPLYWTALGGAAAATADKLASKLSQSRKRALDWAGVSVGAAVLFLGTHELVRIERAMSPAESTKDPCENAFAFIRNSVPADEPILTSYPWYLTWLTDDHPSVLTPTNGSPAIAKVISHYGVRWIVTAPPSLGAVTDESTLNLLAAADPNLETSLAFDGEVCDVYQLVR